MSSGRTNYQQRRARTNVCLCNTFSICYEHLFQTYEYAQVHVIRGTQYVTDHTIIAQLKTEIWVAIVFRRSVNNIDHYLTL